MTRVAVLLRGVNVGRAKRISSAQLLTVVGECGVSDAVTLLNSGNAVGSASATPVALAAAVSAEVERQCGFMCDVVVRTQAHIERALARDPLGSVATDPSRHLLIAMGKAPSDSAVRALEKMDLAPDQWELDGADLHAWLPEGVSSSPLQKVLAAGALGSPWTGRNWSTIGRIAAAMHSAPTGS